MGRAERRKAEREERKYRVKNDAVIRRNEECDARINAHVAEIERNGITFKDLQRNWEMGYDAGRKSGTNDCGKTMFAAAVLALHEEFGFGAERCYKLIKSMADKVIYSLTSEDLIDEVMNKVGIEINLDDPLEPVKLIKKQRIGKAFDAMCAQNGIEPSDMPFTDIDEEG